jgi:hypothetical protein
MSYRAEILVERGDLIDRMAAMRIWLDKRRLDPQTFRHRTEEQSIRILADFGHELEAVLFAEAFGGRAIEIDGEAPPPKEDAA